MYKALIDGQSLTDSKFLDTYNVVATYEERWPGEDPEVLHMSKVRLEDGQAHDFIEKLSSKGLEEGWFTLVWNQENVYAVFKDKMLLLRNMNPWDEKEFAELVEYGKQHQIDKKYFLNMRSVMENW